jgi:hypothetical protein
MFKNLWCGLALFAAASHPGLADQWNKNFTVGAQPEVRVDTNDADVAVRVSNVTAIGARVITSGWRIGPGDVRVAEHQTGDHVDLEVKIPPLHFNFGQRWVKIELEVPPATKADIHTGDGNIRATGLRGPIKLVTHDGNITGEDCDGALEASSGDGNIHVHGRFSSLDLHSGDGNIEAEVRPGSRMTGSWTVRSGDGGVTLRLPHDFAADLEAHTGDGSITVDLPVTTRGGEHENSLVGKLNGGGALLTIHTGDGSIHLSQM